MPSVRYSNGQEAFSIDDVSKAGYIYYPTGKTAVVIATASSYQNSFYAYDKDKENTLLLCLNENAVGFCTGSKRKSADIPNMSLVFSKTGGVLTAADGSIAKDWVWARKCSSDTVLSDPIEIHLSEHFKLFCASREIISLEFNCEGVKYTADLGTKVLRKKESYLKDAKRLPGGHLLPAIERVSLKQRTLDFNDSMRAQRNKLHPKSENLSEMVRDVVFGLEEKFDEIDGRMMTVPGLDHAAWKTVSLESTLREIPHIPVAGTETGLSKGFAEHIYCDPTAFDPSQTLPKSLMTSNGKWKGSVEIRAALEDANPPIKRTFVLSSGSGRYSNMIVVNPKAVTSQNPTGMIKTIGLPLTLLKWSTLKEMFSTAPAAPIPGSPLIVALVMRDGEPASVIAKGVAEYVNLQYSQKKGDASSSSKSGSVEMMKIDVSQNSSILEELQVKSLPIFLMINSGKIAYAGPVGGKKVHISLSSQRAQVLIIEPTFKHQIAMEKTLKNNGCDGFLCLDIQQALERLHQISQVDTNGAPPMVFDLVLISEDVKSGDFDQLYRKLGGLIKSKRTVVACMVSVLGENGKKVLNAVKWTDYCSSEVNSVVEGPIANIVSVIIQKPIKASSLYSLLELRQVPVEDVNFGLSPKTLMSKISVVQQSLISNDGVKRGSTSASPSIGIKLSAEDVKLRGRKLIKSS